MLLCRNRSLKITALFLTLFVTTQAQTQTNSRSYDTNDWIPVSKPGGQNDGEQPVQKRPGRVLNLPPRDEKRLYPAEPSETHQPPYRVPLNHQPSKDGRRENHQMHHHHHNQQSHRQFPIQPNKYPQPPPPQAEFLPTPQQQILLPPQLQGIINQGPSYLTPQRINAQLLQDYQSSIETLPTQQYPLNATEFNPGNLVQNINLGLYDQQPVSIPAQHNQPHLQHQHHQQHRQHHHQQPSIKPVENNEEQEVQLLYVPLEDLQRQRGQRQQINFPTEQQVVPTVQEQIYHQQPQQYRPPQQNKQIKLQNLEQEYVQQALHAQKLQEQFQKHNSQPPVQLQHSYRGQFLQESITKPVTTAVPISSPAPTPKKRKPHQPPLAVYMGTEGHEEIKIGDVLTILKDAKSISVQDSVGPDSPQIFVGPSHLEAPDGYAKFELPYLSSIEGNRIERKVDQLPFFVAPLSYKAPPGYSKIPFPAPHVGSVVVNHLKATPTLPTSTEHTRYASTQNAEDSNSQSFEITTLRSRARQRLPSRGHSVSTIQTPLPSDIPYGPLPTKVSTEKQASYSAEDFNPYGPTRYVQSTTPSTFEKAIPEQIFATKNRFSAPTASYSNNKNSPVRHQTQYLAVSTEPNPSSTLSGGLSNDKYTVLEEFIANKQPQFEDHSKGPSRQQIHFRPTQNTYVDESGEKTALPLISSTKTHSADEYNLPSVQSYKPTFIQKDEQVQYASTPTSTKHRIVESYTNIQAEQPITQNSPTYEIASHQTREQEHFVPDYYGTHVDNKTPTRQTVTQFSNQEGKSPSRTRGKQHFSPENYFQEDDYETDNKHYKSTEAQISSTRGPIIPYKLPEIQSHYVSEVAESYVTPETYHNQEAHKPEYVLPAELPPISPQLPGLINSLQDQALRPLLAPLLIPASEQTPIEAADSSAEYYSSPEPITTTTAAITTTTITTPAPYIETTTQSKRIRSRVRGTRPTTSHDYVSTTISPRRPPTSTSYRGRRPNYNPPRPEYTKTRENYPVSSTGQSEEVIESTTRAVFSRNRHIPPRERQYVASTTEQPRRVSPSTVSPASRQRFRTRGRPNKSEEDFTERSYLENGPVFKQPVYEGGFQASHPIIQDIPQVNIPTAQSQIYYDDNQKDVSIQRDVSAQRAQTEKALVYVQNKPNLPDGEAVPVYSARPNYISSTESLEPLFHSTIATSAPDNNIVHDQPAVLINSSPSSHLKYPSTESNVNAEVEYNSREPSRLRYKESQEVKDDPTTEVTRSRTRQRVKTRPRVNQVTTSRYSQQSTTPASSRSSNEGSEESGEFYGFFRQPNFQKPVQVEYKQEVEVQPVQRVTPTVAYIRRPTEESRRVYVSPESPIYSTPKTYSPVTHLEDNHAYPNIQSQYVSSTLSPSSVSAEESDEIQPITRRPASNLNRARRPNTPVRSDNVQSSEKYYTRTTKRPDAAAPATRIRSRVRKPLRPTSRPTSSEENSYSHSPRTNELENQSSEDYQEVPKSSRTRITNNRGKTHFHNPQVEKNTDAELDEENYPTVFLQGQNIQQHRPHTGHVAAESTQRSLVSAEAITPRTSFHLTIEPEDSAEDYRDQVPNYSVNKPKVTSKDLEDGIEESQVSAKFVKKPQNYNFISADSKSLEDRLAIKQTTVSEVITSSLTTTPATSTSENNENILITLEPEAATDSSEMLTTDSPTTTEETVTDKPRKRGVWKLSKIRPVTEEFESAESQNVGAVLDNEFSTEKTFKKYNFANRIRATEPTVFETTTAPIIPETTVMHENEEESKETTTTTTTEASILDPLYEMFGFSDSDDNNNEEIVVPPTTESSNVYTTISDEVTTIPHQYNATTHTPDQLTTSEESEEAPSTPRILGTSTTTEISHETEICYRGKCIKSTSTEIIDKL